MARAVLTDIEGTTSSLAFVHDVLFPYARTRLASFVAARGHEPAVRAILDAVAEESGDPRGDDALVGRLLTWMDEDRKVGSLKALQGLLWEEGYRRGELRGQVYEDAARRLAEWHRAGLVLAVYSSGSVHAQRLLFSCSDFGDLSPLFAAHFDTAIGPKRSAASYAAIAAALALPPHEILFLSDIREELDAAAAVGMKTTLLVRGEGPRQDPGGHDVAASFDAIAPANL